MLKNADEYLNIAMSLIGDIDCTNKHISFIIQRNRILSIGTNSSKTHPLAVRKGYPLEQMHSELTAVIRAGRNVELKKCRLVNVRLSSTSLVVDRPILRLSKPCKICSSWCLGLFKEIYYTDENGFVKYE
jgi:hypothetical protein